jgi:hypothetical protein
VEGGGFEPPKAEPSDLQSDPFDHSGTPPKCKPAILFQQPSAVNTIAAIELKESTVALPGRTGTAVVARQGHNWQLQIQAP